MRLSRAITWLAVSVRSLQGLSWMYIRPLFCVCPPDPAPTDEVSAATAGSSSTSWFTCFCRRDIASNETSCAASVMAMMMPVSCGGKNPLGMMTNSTPVVARMAKNTISVMNRNRSAMSSVRS